MKKKNENDGPHFKAKTALNHARGSIHREKEGKRLNYLLISFFLFFSPPSYLVEWFRQLESSIVRRAGQQHFQKNLIFETYLSLFHAFGSFSA